MSTGKLFGQLEKLPGVIQKYTSINLEAVLRLVLSEETKVRGAGEGIKDLFKNS